MDEATEQQPRIPGVKYRKVRLYRMETTVLDGVPSTRRVPYDGWEPVPPVEWDELILRGVTSLAVVVTLIAFAGTTASIGGLLSRMVYGLFAYGMGVVFTSVWVACLAVEWLLRIDPQRAQAAQVAGVIALLISMTAVFIYGHMLHQEYVGAIGACVDLLAKGLWWLVLRLHSVPLDPSVAHWVTDQEQKLASRELLSGRLLRLNRRAAYQRAIGGAEYQAAGAILASAQTTSLPTPEPEQAPAPEPAPGPHAATAAAPTTPAAAPAEPQTATPASPAPPAADGGAAPHITAITRQPIAAICRAEIAANAKVSDADLLGAVKKAGHPDRPNLADTVRRTALRIDPARKAS